jgi:hypothetical protein
VENYSHASRPLSSRHANRFDAGFSRRDAENSSASAVARTAATRGIVQGVTLNAASGRLSGRFPGIIDG